MEGHHYVVVYQLTSINLSPFLRPIYDLTLRNDPPPLIIKQVRYNVIDLGFHLD